MTQKFADIRTPMHPGSRRSRRRSQSGAAIDAASLRAAGGSSLAYRIGYAAVVAPRDPGASAFSVFGDFWVRTLAA
jgi:hypothetical protein